MNYIKKYRVSVQLDSETVEFNSDNKVIFKLDNKDKLLDCVNDVEFLECQTYDNEPEVSIINRALWRMCGTKGIYRIYIVDLSGMEELDEKDTN